MGLAGTGTASGVAVGQFEVLASLIFLILGGVFVPRRGTVFAGYLNLLPLFIVVVPGVIDYALSQRGGL